MPLHAAAGAVAPFALDVQAKERRWQSPQGGIGFKKGGERGCLMKMGKLKGTTPRGEEGGVWGLGSGARSRLPSHHHDTSTPEARPPRLHDVHPRPTRFFFGSHHASQPLMPQPLPIPHCRALAPATAAAALLVLAMPVGATLSP